MVIKRTRGRRALSGTTQDFLLFDAPAFFVGDPLQYVEFEEATLRGVGRSKPGTLATLFLGYYARHPRQFLNLLKTQRGDVTDPLAIRAIGVATSQPGKGSSWHISVSIATARRPSSPARPICSAKR